MVSVKQNFVYNSFLTVSNYLINLILFPYCARVLGVERYGTITFTENIVQYFLFIAMMGISHVGVREIAKYNDRESCDKCYSSILVLSILFTILSLLIYLPLVFFVDRFVEIRLLLFLGCFQIFFTTLSVDWYFRGTENFRYITLRNLCLKIIYVICVLLFVNSPDDYVLLYILTVLTTIISATINQLYSRNFVRFSWSFVNIRPYIKSSLSLGAYSILTSMYTTFNVAYLGFVWNDIQVGYYTTAIKLYTVVLGFYSAFTMVMLPRMSSINQDKRGNEVFQSMIEKSVNLLFTFAIPLTLFLFVLAPDIILILAGTQYVPSVSMSRIVIPMLLIVGLAQLLSFQILIPKGFDRFTLYASIIGASIGIISNLLLTTKYGAIGTAITVAITEISVTSFYVIITIKRSLFSLRMNVILTNILISIPYIFLCILSQSLFKQSHWAVILVAVVLCTTYFLFSQLYILKNELIKRQFHNFFKLKQ